MIVRHQTHGTLRLITQHEHALLSGELARAWCGPEGREPLALGCILATALHDYAWVEADQAIARRAELFDEARGLPHDFMTLPAAPKVAMYRHGVDEVERIDLYSALLKSRHYEVFVTEDQDPGFKDHERQRQRRLLAHYQLDADDARVARELRLLQWFDLLSLHICLAGPDVVEADTPGWLEPPFALDGQQYRFTWRDPDTVTLAPWPFCVEHLVRTIPVRDLRLPQGAACYPDREAFQAAYEAADERLWKLRIVR